jgi:hypothetical protein
MRPPPVSLLYEYEIAAEIKRSYVWMIVKERGKGK